MENLPAPKTETPLQRLRRAVSRVPLFPRKKFVQPDLDDREILFNPDTYHPRLISPGSISNTHPDGSARKEEVRDLKDLETDLRLEDEFYIPDIGDISPPQLHSDNSFNNFGIIPDVNRNFSTSPPSEGLTSNPTGIWDERRNEDQRRNKDQRPDEDQSRQTNDEAKRPDTPWEEPIQVNKLGLTNFDDLVRIASPVQQPTTNSVQQPITGPVQQPIASPVQPPKRPKNSRANRTYNISFALFK
ncbi:uncharacterized protein LOC134277048 [Saccostrea cucullata]|uniref:uncharacterized protein LOC134277048 n=1 Tax=Saccostrea cuccullata TaxID=36930 RepID=UPI002ED42844